MPTDADTDRLIARLTKALKLETSLPGGSASPLFDPDLEGLYCPHCRTMTVGSEPLLHYPDCPHRIVSEALADGERHLMGYPT